MHARPGVEIVRRVVGEERLVRAAPVGLEVGQIRMHRGPERAGVAVRERVEGDERGLELRDGLPRPATEERQLGKEPAKLGLAKGVAESFELAPGVEPVGLGGLDVAMVERELPEQLEGTRPRRPRGPVPGFVKERGRPVLVVQTQRHLGSGHRRPTCGVAVRRPKAVEGPARVALRFIEARSGEGELRELKQGLPATHGVSGGAETLRGRAQSVLGRYGVHGP